MKEILLNRGYMAILDDEDYEKTFPYHWYVKVSKSGQVFYAASYLPYDGRRCKTIFLHRLIMDAKPGQQIDHIDGNGLDCRRQNMRFCTPKANKYNQRPYRKNTSGYKGVSWYKNLNKWVAAINVGGKRMFLGYYVDPIAAAKVYDEAARQYQGEFAWLNFR